MIASARARILTMVVCVLLAPFFLVEGAQVLAPEPVSPGRAAGELGVAADRCPTFSWSAVPGALGYEVALFPWPESLQPVVILAPPSAEPLLLVDIPSPASSWTPSVEQCLDAGGRYMWFVREKGQFGRRNGEWSRGSSFAVAEQKAFDARTLDEVLERVKGLEKQNGQWSDRLKASPDFLATSIEELSNKLDGLFTSVTEGTVTYYAYQARNYAKGTSDWKDDVGNLEDVKTAALNINQLYTDNQANFTGDVKRLLEMGAARTKVLAAEELVGLGDFVGPEDCGVGSPCFEFRNKLIVQVGRMRELADAFLELGTDGAATRAGINAGALSTLLHKIPGAALYPLYRLAVQESNLLDFLAVGQLPTDIRTATQIFSTGDSALSPTGGRLAVSSHAGNQCDVARTHELTLTEIANRLFFASLRYRAFGAYAGYKGETNVHGLTGAQGWVTVSIESNPPKQLAGVLNTMGALCGELSNAISNIQKQCQNAAAQDEIKLGVDGINERIDAVEAGLPADLESSIESIQTSVGDLDSDLAAHNQTLVNHDQRLSDISATLSVHDLHLSAHEAAVSEGISALGARAETIENDLEHVQIRLDAIESAGAAQLQAGIERQLATCQPLITLVLPRSFSGHLETVMELVRSLIEKSAAAGLDISKANKFYEAAQGDLASARYVKAFDSVCKAYQSLTSG